MYRTPCVILDAQERIIAVLVGRPTDEQDAKRPTEKRWMSSVARLAAAFEKARTKEGRVFSEGNRRGDFVAESFGVSYGGSQVLPGRLRNSVDLTKMCDAFRADEDLGRVAGFQSDSLASYFPKAYGHMCAQLAKLFASRPDLQHNFKTSAYPTATINFGPCTVCRPHRDSANFPGIACAITALGGFDAAKGGHLVFYDLGLKVRFPPGSTILLSSASLRHGNLPIQEGETRYSFTQYCPGGLMRWVRHGLCPASRLSKSARAELDGEGKDGLQWQLSRLSRLEELEEDRRWLVNWETTRDG
ncbi:hypothetical protein FA95DRAFT_1505840 [Auriscalpium vulgare]|uniref:Uncharacterized protein n=1 Tax=Auriscalpium vulgare TaxID=40419 RepID=A0ACB8R3K3_9AGAM|nr:hypothetical protein FA95DRAFT_1505840 [Auriscalpium vulgare]